jgi:hypothetical protein
MRGFLRIFEDMFAAVAFAEAGEHKNALDILRGSENEIYEIKKDFKKKVAAPVMS